MDRRRFLKWSAVGAGGLVVGAGAGLTALHPKRALATWPEDAAKPDKAQVRKRVVVVGAGIAGIAAALELQARNFEVTLVERAAELGGKLTGWKVDALGETFPVEHGFHGFFAQYHNLNELLAGAGIDKTGLADFPDYDVVFKDRPTDRYARNATTRFPFNMLGVVAGSKNLHIADFANSGTGLYDLMRFDAHKTFARFDGVDFAKFCVDGKINQPMIDCVLEPFGKTTLNRTARLSAAEAIRFFHFYFMGNPDGLTFRYPFKDLMTSVIGPLEARFVALGGIVKKGVGARRILSSGSAVAAVELDGASGAQAAEVRVARADVPEEGWRALLRPDGSSVYVARRGEEILALDGRCTHMGCPIAPDPATGGFRCPCHAGRFDREGTVTSGPPPRPLARLKVLGQEHLTIEAADASGVLGEKVPCDHCVVACEVRGIKRLFAASALPAPELHARVESLGEADPYIVWRLWLDRPLRAGRSMFYTVSGYRYTDSIAMYSMLQEPYISWAKRSGGSAIEIHGYGVRPELVVGEAEIRRAMFEEVVQVLPELRGAKILYDVYMQQNNFSRCAPGDDAQRPTTTTSLANLFLAGDHVKIAQPAALMEAATMSGRLAANAILEREGVKRIPIPSVALKGPLA